MAAAATRAWRPAAGWGWALEKYTHKYFVKKINEKYFNDPVAEPQKAEFPFAGWDGGGVLFEDVFSGAEHVVEDEVEPVQGLEVEEEHLPVRLLHALRQGGRVLVLPGPLQNICFKFIIYRKPSKLSDCRRWERYFYLKELSICKWMQSARQLCPGNYITGNKKGWIDIISIHLLSTQFDKRIIQCKFSFEQKYDQTKFWVTKLNILWPLTVHHWMKNCTSRCFFN